MSENKLPKINDLYKDVQLAQSNDVLTALLNQPPKQEWVKIHPYISGYKYLPIDKVEFLLKKIFKAYRIEVLREGTAFNGVYVIVRVHYQNPVTGEWDYHDGVGAKELQTKKGESAANLAMINPGALAMAFPIAKTVAIKDACDHFGMLFGSDLNRKDVMSINVDESLQSRSVIDDINKLVKQPVKETHDFEVIQPETVSSEPLPPVEPKPIETPPAPEPLKPAVPELPSDEDF